MRKNILLLMLLMNVIWAGSYAATKVLMQTTPFYMVTSLRYFIAAVPLTILTVRQYGLSMNAADLGKCALIGISTFTLCPVLMYAGVDISRAADAAVLTSMEPILVSLGAYIYLREKVAPRIFIALLIAFCGSLILSEFWKESGQINPLGTFLIIGGVFFEAIYSVIGKELLKRHSPLKITTVSILIACALNAFAISFLDYWKHIPSLTFSNWLILAGYLAGLCTFVGYTFWYVALKTHAASNIAITIFTQPVFGILIAWVWVNETPTVSQIAGTTTILVAVSWALIGTKKPLPTKAQGA